MKKVYQKVISRGRWISENKYQAITIDIKEKRMETVKLIKKYYYSFNCPLCKGESMIILPIHDHPYIECLPCKAKFKWEITDDQYDKEYNKVAPV